MVVSAGASPEGGSPAAPRRAAALRRARRAWPRRQPPVHSPLTGGGIWRAAAQLARSAPDPRPRLLSRLLHDFDAPRGVLCGSGTQALQLAIRLARAWTGSATVALPAYGCFDVAAAAAGAGVAVELYDLDPATLSPDPDSLEAALRAGARIVVAGPLYGVPVRWAEVAELADRYGAVVVEDAAQGHGARWRGAPVGALGAASVLSFGRGKGWTGAHGGALLLRSPSESAAAHAWPDPGPRAEARVLLSALAQWALGRPSLYAIPRALPGLRLGETLYRDPSAPGPITRTAAALLEHAHDGAAREARVRQENARRLLEAVAGGPRVRTIRIEEGAAPGYLRLPLRLEGGIGALADPALALRLGISPGYPARLAELPQLRPYLARSPGRLPGAAALVRELVTLPTHSHTTAEDRQRMLRLVDTAAR